MTGTVARPVSGPADMTTGHTLSPAYVNAFRISAVTSRLLAHVHGDARSDNAEFCNLCLSLARGIDYAVSNNEVPGRAPDLPYLLNQVCQRKNDLPSQAAVMVLMISVKSACSNGWFSERAKEELYVLSKEVQSRFCSVSVDDLNSHVKNKESSLHPTISTIMSRFYPGMKMGEIFAIVETKPGYDSYMTDLYISKSSRTSPDEKISLFVAQTDNTETSSCLITPQQANFLLNGVGVNKRTVIYKDPGPQMPTPVTHMLKYGSNLLQVVGQFNGRYIIVIGFMSVVANPSFPTIPDYVPPVATQSDPDNEIVEGPSRVSLKCPISFSRINIPVKGQTCKHLQCFDYNNYMGINSRTPLWRCPHCNQSVCVPDIRIDQSMVKILKEVAEDVCFVEISSDGSWQAVTGNISNETTEKPNDAPPSNQETVAQNVDDIMDLTVDDYEIDKTDKDDDQKPLPAGESSFMTKNVAPHMEDGFWRDFYTSTHGTETTNNTIQRQHGFNSLTLGQSQSQSQVPVANTMQSQQIENSSNNGNGHARYPTPASWITRIPNAIQALPAPTSARPVDADRQQNISTSYPHQHMNSQGQPNHLLLPSQSQTLPQFRRSPSPSPQPTNGSRHILPTDRFNSNRQSQYPVRSSGQPYPHVPLASSQSPTYPLPGIQQATSQIQTSGPSSLPVAVTPDQRGSSVNASGEETQRPTGRMRGSLSGWQYTEAVRKQSVIQPSQPVQAARPPPVMNTPRPFIPPHLQSLMANNPRPQAGGNSPGSGSGSGSDTNMAGGPGSDK
ncbi:E4 SUMO-protein ligase PIAL2-like [Bidens hawaiensis]|uniref:E4 SUMO-protein ligase PIAL2-like n=1 Tax=Bidens hawaiensis TaxID=980011 RepID=UPI00404AFD86